MPASNDRQEMFLTYIVLLEDPGVPERVLGGQDDVLHEFGVGQRPHLVVSVDASEGAGVDAARIHPLGLGGAVMVAAAHGGGEQWCRRRRGRQEQQHGAD